MPNLQEESKIQESLKSKKKLNSLPYKKAIFEVEQKKNDNRTSTKNSVVADNEDVYST